MSDEARQKAVDAVMTYWLNGCEEESMLEWWTSKDAVESAGEIVDAVLAAVGGGA